MVASRPSFLKNPSSTAAIAGKYDGETISGMAMRSGTIAPSTTSSFEKPALHLGRRNHTGLAPSEPAIAVAGDPAIEAIAQQTPSLVRTARGLYGSMPPAARRHQTP